MDSNLYLSFKGNEISIHSTSNIELGEPRKKILIYLFSAEKDICLNVLDIVKKKPRISGL